MPYSAFYDTDALERVAINLFYGWGYNFYRTENQLRSDDQLIRAKAAWLLGSAATAVTAAETEFRREFLPAPTRAKPFPDAEAVAGAQKLERLAREISALEAFIHQQPVPENDRMTQRFRLEAPTLRTLAQHDKQLVGQCELLRSMTDGQNGAALLKSIADFDNGLQAIHETLRKREAVLHDCV